MGFYMYFKIHLKNSEKIIILLKNMGNYIKIYWKNVVCWKWGTKNFFVLYEGDEKNFFVIFHIWYLVIL